MKTEQTDQKEKVERLRMNSEGEELIKECDTKPPSLSDENVIALCKKLFDIDVERVLELNSYDDRNYNVVTNVGDKFVLKLTNSQDTNEPNLIESQNEMIILLHQKKFHVPYPMKNVVDGNLVFRASLPSLDNHLNSEKRYAIRLLHHISGDILYNIKIDHQLLIDCGQYLASINLTLEQFNNEIIRKRKFLWALDNVPKLPQYLRYINEPYRRELASNCIKEFVCLMTSSMDSLKHCYLHGDFNEQNIIVQKNDSNNSYQVHGLIDFGDICYGPRIYDISIFIAYVMLLNTDFDPIFDGPKFVLQGYCNMIPLAQKDVQMILICAKARLSQSLTLGAYTYSFQPNNEYLLTTARKGWKILERLCGYEEQQLIDYWLGCSY